ncbi:MAG: rod shape-determining protein RodA [Clostridiales bacterium]|nr:rod shape-determining protein RodA [Clostridiales bacterium]
MEGYAIDKKLISNFDFWIVILIITISLFGMLGIGIAMRSPMEGNESIGEIIGNLNLRYVKFQALWVAVGLVVLVIMASIDFNNYKTLIPYAYVAVILLLLYVSKWGRVAGNARRAMEIGPVSIQPSEFAKLIIIVITAKALEKKENLRSFKSMFLVLAQILPILILTIKQPDMGTTLVYIIIIAGMLFIGGLDYRFIFSLIGAGIVSIPIAWKFIFSDTQKKRVLVLLNPELEPLGDAYNVIQSMTAIGSGRLYGKGVLTGNTLSQLNFLPAKHTDFIFSVTVETLGFIGGAIIILLYMLLILRTVAISNRAEDRFGSLIVIGVATMMFFHIFENIGMTMGIMPVTGIPLPFMSYGGSSMLTNMAAYGMVISVAMRRHKIRF